LGRAETPFFAVAQRPGGWGRRKRRAVLRRAARLGRASGRGVVRAWLDL